MRIFELTGEAPIARARVLEIPVKDFGLKEIRSDFHKTGASNWAAWASAVGSRTLNQGERHYALEYFSYASTLNVLVGSAVKALVEATRWKGRKGFYERCRWEEQ